MTDSKTLDADQANLTQAADPDKIQGNIPDEGSGHVWFRHFWPLLLSATLSLIWTGLCIWWFWESDKTLARMPIYEVGGLLAGATLPLLLIWLIALVYLRTDPLRDHRMALAHGLDELLTPLDVAQRRANAIVAGLHKEISHVEAAGDIATTRIDNLKNRFQEQISNLFEVTTDAEVKAVNIQEILSAERQAFTNQLIKVTGNITELESLFRQLKFDSETIANTTRKNSEGVSAELAVQNRLLDERSRLIGEQLEIMAGELGKMSREVSGNCELSENRLRSISQAMSEKQAALTETVTGLCHNADQICDKMDKQSTIIAALSQKTAEESEKITATLQEQSTGLSTAAAEALSQTDAMSRKLNEAGDSFKANATAIVQSSQNLSENLIDHMGRATDDLDAKSETLEHTIAARVNMVEEALEKQAEKAREFITGQGEDFVGEMERTVSSIETQAKRIDKAVQLTTTSLGQNTVKMNDHFSSFEQLTEKFRSRVDQSEIQIRNRHEELVRNLSDVAEYLDDGLQNLKSQTGSLGEHAQEIISNIVGQTEQLSGLIDNIRDRTENTIRNVQEMGDTVSHHFTATDEQAASLSENWLKTASLVENQCANTLSRLDGLSDKLAELEKENDRAAEAAESNVSKVVGQMDHASESIFLASASATEAADETNRAIEQHAEKFQQLINALQMSNKSILIDAEAIEQKNRDKTGSHFSNLASRVIEQLQSLSIDINRYFESDVPDKVWQSYVDGDKNTFVRRLKKVTDKKHAANIRDKYKDDPEFRKNALEYIHIFEDLMSQSMASDNYSIFSVALISSETGKVYLALAQALNRFSS